MTKLIVANWKMNGTRETLTQLTHQILQIKIDHTVVLCPPFLYFHAIGSLLHAPFSLGAQDCSPKEHGAYTGDISAPMLQDLNVTYVILGHSERRLYHRESNELIEAKYKAALKANLKPILCVGETEEEKSQGLTQSVLKAQLEGFPITPHPIIAYEPRWAIGTGKIPSLEDIQSIHHFIRSIVSPNALVLYGGSVTGDNSQAIGDVEGVDGFLVGGASLKVEEFMKILGSTKS